MPTQQDDELVEIELDLDEETLAQLEAMAAERDVTIDTIVSEILEEEIRRCLLRDAVAALARHRSTMEALA